MFQKESSEASVFLHKNNRITPESNDNWIEYPVMENLYYEALMEAFGVHSSVFSQ